MPRKIRKAGEDQGIVYGCNAYLNQRWEDILRQFDAAAPGGLAHRTPKSLG